MTGEQMLCNAIIEQAAKDFREAAGKLKKKPNDTAAKSRIRELQSFFLSDWFTELSDVDGKWLLKKLRMEADL